jgi:magnesium chelatase subunit D
MSRVLYPFTAVVGQERMKLALVLNAVHPALGGVLVRGHKGTAKSTAARGLADLLPPVETVAGCPFQCPQDADGNCPHGTGRQERPTPVIDLPLGATEDRLVGTLNLEEAIQKGRRRFEPGLLAAAHRGILYVDEVNLLDDHLVDVLLDAAAMGVNVVEREGVSETHPARFVLIGTMNPEEGELRPQFVDRFGLCVDVVGIDAPADRAEVVRRRLRFEVDPDGFRREWAAEQEKLAGEIAAARAFLPQVSVPDDLLDGVARLTVEVGVHGHRADLAIVRTATTLAALRQHPTVTADDVRTAAELVLPHRLRRTPFEPPQRQREKLDQSIRDALSPPPSANGTPPPAEPNGLPEEGKKKSGDPDPVTFAPGDPYAVRPLAPEAKPKAAPAGRRAEAADTRSGRYARAVVPRHPDRLRADDLALDATLRAAAPFQPARRPVGATGLVVRPTDYRAKARRRKAGTTVLFVVDSSGSMGARQRMAAAKTAVLSLLLDAYRRRDRVGLIAFRGAGAELLLPPTSSVELAQARLSDLPTGGRTPLAHAFRLAADTLRADRRKHRHAVPFLVLLTDGHATAPLGPGNDPVADAVAAAEALRADAVPAVVLDCETGRVRLGLAARVAAALGTRSLSLDDIRAERIEAVVRDYTRVGR